MSKLIFVPTKEQARVINHEGSAFVSACPGAGKTRVIVERARKVLEAGCGGRGIALLSFTRGAISELGERLRRESLLKTPEFPNFLGTFDNFIWQFFVGPFGIPGVEASPRIIPDKRAFLTKPFPSSRPLPLSCFDRRSGAADPAELRRVRFDTSKNNIKAYETCARNMLNRFLKSGHLDFDDARELALSRIGDKDFAKRLAAALAGRFRELIVDEAQDCNPLDLEIIKWLRDSGLPTKVVCDPDQAIYEFRGGVTDHLLAFAGTFEAKDRLNMRGNFRSGKNICRTIVALRSSGSRELSDEPLGDLKDEALPVYVLSYGGSAVRDVIGKRFLETLAELRMVVSEARVLAATRSSGCKAIGQPGDEPPEDLTLRLAQAVSDFYFSFETRVQISSLEEIHKIILALEGRWTESQSTYHQFIIANNIEPEVWRPKAIRIIRELRYTQDSFVDPAAWHRRAKELLAPCLSGGDSIAQRLRWNASLSSVLVPPPSDALVAQTIHAVKGMEFTAVCVVTTASTFKGILDFLKDGLRADVAEGARKLYVAASRARRLLVFAVPKSQSARFAAHLRTTGADVKELAV